MKNLKQITKIACVAVGLLATSNYISAQTITMNISGSPEPSGTVYLCPGVTYTVDYSAPGELTGSCSTGSGYSWNGSAPSSFTPEANSCVINIPAGSAYQAAVTATNGSGDCYSFAANFLAVETNITATSYSPYCKGATPTFTANCNSQAITGYTWVVPSSLMSITSGAGTSSIATSTNHHGNGYVEVTVTTSDGCPSGNSGVNAQYQAVIDSGTPTIPGGSLVYTQAGKDCEFNANVYYLGATAFRWGKNLGFTSLYCSNTTTGTTTGGPFDPSTTYTVYVEVQNACSATNWSPYQTYMGTTPAKPGMCIEGRFKPNEQSAVSTDFKLYPNPANNTLSIEYPASADNSEAICEMYDMLGHKVASWNLPNADNKVIENTSVLQAGAYLYVVRSGDTILTRGKLMIQR